nr:uncharacterized protein LOC113708191 [Coffea arabica]
MAKPVLSDRLARWYLQFQQFEIIYVPAKAVKGQILADFLADHPLPAEWELTDELPDEEVFMVELPWSMYFDGAGDGADMKQLHLRVYGDSKLVVNQLLGVYDVKKPELIPYYKYARQLMGYLGNVTIEHIPRNFNQQADSLARVASMITLPSHRNQISICQNWVIPPMFDEGNDSEEENTYHIFVHEIEKEDWRHLIIDYLNHGKLPEDPKKRVDIRRRAPRFIYYKGTLYRRSFDGVFLRCLGEDEAMQAMEEAHSGICGAHQSGPKLHFRIKRMGYYWPTMLDHFQSLLADMFLFWRDDYFSKWAEAIPLREVKKENVVDFIRLHIIYRYGVPRYIITDNGKPFCNVAMNKLCEKFHFKQYNSSMYYAAANGLAEAFNKTLCNLLKKVVNKSRRDWHLRIGEALWAYRTTFRTPTQATPYALVYGVEAVLPLECQIPSLRIAIQEGLSGEDNVVFALRS